MIYFINFYSNSSLLCALKQGGSILGVFLKIKAIFDKNYKLRICRVKTRDTKRVIGISVPCVLLSRVKAEINLLKK